MGTWYDPFDTQNSSGGGLSPSSSFYKKPTTGVYVNPVRTAPTVVPTVGASAYDSRRTPTPSVPSGGSAYDSRYRPTPSAPSIPSGGTDIETRRATNVAGRPQTGLTAEEEAANILKTLDGLNFPTTGGGGSGLTSQQQAAMRAIATLQGRLTAPSETDALQARIADIYKQAEDRIRAAGGELSSTLSTPTPTRSITQVAPVGTTAMSDYLNAIGASGADVSAQQALSNSILSSMAGSAQQYSTGMTEAQDLIRQALAGAVPANQLAGISQASLNRAALESRLAAQKAQERQSVQDQILELALKYGVNV